MHHRDLTIPVADGIQLAGRRLGELWAPSTVVYVHGLLTDSSYWTPLTQCVDQRMGSGIAQIVYDQRGHGRSGRPHRHLSTTMPQLVEDLDTVLAHACGKVVLVSHSAGSLLVHAWAERYPRRATALAALVMFHGSGEFPEFDNLPKRYRTWPARLHRWRHGPLDPMSAAGAILLERLFRRSHPRHGSPADVLPPTRCDPRVVTDVLGAYSRASLSSEVAEQLRSVPSFIVAAEHDRVVPPAQSVRLADRIWADYELVPGAGHSFPFTHPERAAETILQALEVAYRSDETDSIDTDPGTAAVQDPT